MKRSGFEFPREQQRELARARTLAWATIAFLVTIAVTMFFAMGSSQAMKAAWAEDLLSFIPPIAFLVSVRYAQRPPTDRFPYGYHRAVSIAFLAGAVALTVFGLLILVDSVVKLAKLEHPTLGVRRVFGYDLWEGWLMIAALAYSAIPPLVLGRMKLRPARALHDKTLAADADMNKADWLTAVAGIGGIVGVGYGWWWADGAAAFIISVDVVKDGFTNIKRVVADMMDERPTTIDGEVSPLPDRVRDAVRALPYVADARPRLREEGHVLVGEIFVALRDERDLAARFAEIRRVAETTHWSVHEVVVTLVQDVDAPAPR